MTETDTKNSVQWTLGEEDNSEERDVFPHHDDDNLMFNGQSNNGNQQQGGLNASAQKALLEKRKRLK